MSRIQEFLDVLNNPTAVVQGSHPQDALLLSVMVHVAFADGQVEENEFALLGRLAPAKDPSELMFWITDEAAKPLDTDALVATFTSADDRERLLTFAGHMAWGDNQLEASEVHLIADLARALGVDP